MQYRLTGLMSFAAPSGTAGGRGTGRDLRHCWNVEMDGRSTILLADNYGELKSR